MSNKRAVFLDRDGVINQVMLKDGRPYPPASLEELNLTEGVVPALQILKSLGYLLIVVTNQPDISRGKIKKDIVQSIHQTLAQMLPLDDIYICEHDDSDGCFCRKPSPGLLLLAATKYHISLQESIMIGDRWRDIEAGQRVGCKTIWINQQYKEPGPKQSPNVIVSSLSQAVEWIQKII